MIGERTDAAAALHPETGTGENGVDGELATLLEQRLSLLLVINAEPIELRRGDDDAGV